MRYTTARDTDPELAALIDTAQQEPVFINYCGQEVAVLLSARDYEHLSGKVARKFNEFCDKVADEAVARGLTEEKLQEILDHV